MRFFFSIILTSITLYCLITSFAQKAESSENNPPIISITTSLNNNKFQWNTLVHYTINVSDKEDGISEYNEITTGEVMLKVVYLRDSSNIKKYLSNKSKSSGMEPAGLSLIKTSACFTCHAAKNKLLGPSLQLIATRYPDNPTSIETLARKVMKGSSGTWGKKPMPPHPDLKTAQVKEMISWILKNNTNPDVTYFTGIEGAFRTKQKPEKNAGKGVYILTASYTDHGLKGVPLSSKRGQQTIILKNY